MKILLTTLNSKYVHSNLALKYLYSVAVGSGLDITLREFTINNEMGYIYGEILRGGYDLVCFSTYIWNVEQICRLGKTLKQANPSMKIMLGGPEVSYEAAEFMEENPWADYILRGEGELGFFRFCKELVLGGGVLSALNPEKVCGLSYRRDREILETADGAALSMENLPFPYQLLEPEADKVVYYESARGCPYRCSYCLSSLEKNIRALPLERTFEELDYFLSEKVKQVKFIDRTFNWDRNRAREIWAHLMEHDNGTTNFHFEICAELLGEEDFELLGRARDGLFQFEIGIQTANERTLEAINRNSNIPELLSNVEQLIGLGNSHIHVDLIAGLPYEGYNSFGHSFNGVYALGADNLQLGFLKLLKGTKARRQAEEYGYVYRSEAPYEVISNDFISAGELVRLKMIEHVLDLYANKGGFTQSLRYLCEASSATAFRFYEKLSAFFYEEGYQHRSHKKEDLYRILYRFALSLEEDFPGISEKTKVLLSADLEVTMNFDAVKKFHKKGWEIQ